MLCKCASARVRAESSSGTVKHYILQKKIRLPFPDKRGELKLNK